MAEKRRNRGKDFETQLNKDFQKIPNFSCERIRDVIGMFGSKSIADFSLYQKPYKMFLECKTTTTGTLPRANITDTQLNGMYEASNTLGVSAGIIIWFQKFDDTVFIPIHEVYRLFSNPEVRSIKYSELDNILYYRPPSKKKKVMFTYDLSNLVIESERMKNLAMWGYNE